MRRSKTQNIGEVIHAYLQETGLSKKIKEVELINEWEEIVGPTISKKTTRIEIKSGTLVLHIQSSVVRNELMMLRETLRNRLNEKAGEEIIREIILK